MTTYRLLYAYMPATKLKSRLLLAVPPSTEYQTLALIDAGPHTPMAVLSEASNQIELYALEPGQQIFREYSVKINDQPAASNNQCGLIDEHYMRSTTLVDFGQPVCDVARECKRATPRETAVALFERVVERSSYHWPPERRGASAFFEHWRGDCGQMSFAMAAVLRSLAIPARIVVGAFAHPGLNAHAWLEFFDGSSWIVTDAALANAKKPHPTSWFGFAPCDRIVFSYDCDLKLDANIQAPIGKTNVNIAIANEILNWGGSLLNGAVPYLQPGYPLVDEVMARSLTLPVWDISLVPHLMPITIP